MDLWVGGSFDPDRLASEAAAYRAARPFPHAVVRDLFDPDALRRVAAEFPPPKSMSERFDVLDPRHSPGKSAEKRWSTYGPATRALIAELSMGPFVEALSTLTSIPALLADPHLWGGGQHQITNGGRLDVHADFQIHPVYGTTRRVNALLYLNEGWDPAWGGQLELWDAERPVERVEPEANTLVVFSTTASSFHGHPEPVACPPDRTRKSIALYYYTVAPAEDAERNVTTEWHPGDPTARKRWHLPTAGDARRAARYARNAVLAVVPRRW